MDFACNGSVKSRITLVPFAGISLIRFRGSRINGLSLLLKALRQDVTPRERGNAGNLRAKTQELKPGARYSFRR